MLLSCWHPQKLAGGQEIALPCPHPCAHRSAIAVWKSVIEGTAHAGQVRVTASETYRSLATEAARTARLSKERMLKKVLARGCAPPWLGGGDACPPPADVPHRASSGCRRHRRNCWRQ